MKEGHVFRSFTDTGDIYSQQILQNKTLENFLLYLKESLDYEQATIYIYDNITQNSKVDLVEKAINFILKARFKNNIDSDQYSHFKDRLFNYSEVIQVVQLTRVYNRHKEYHYLFVSSYLDGDELNIIIPSELNECSFLGVPSINISQYRKYPSYDDYNHFIEFKEDKVNNNRTHFLQSVCEINMEINYSSPILSSRLKTTYDAISYDRKAQVVLTLYPQDYEFNCDYVIDLSLIYKQKTIKRTVIEHRSVNDLDKIIEKFIFPLAESYELINEWELDPELTAEFMSHDYESYWELKQMVEI
jgi:hypothetical protein